MWVDYCNIVMPAAGIPIRAKCMPSIDDRWHKIATGSSSRDHGSKVTSDAGLLAYRKLDDALGLTEMVGDQLVDPRTGKNGQHAMTGLFRQSVFGRLGGYEDVNDADRLGRDPAMRWTVGGRAVA